MNFKKEARTNYYDCDVNNRLKISAAMRYMQQTSSEHLESIDLSPARLISENMVFLLSKSCIKVHRMPMVSEPIIIGTAATEVRGPRFVREFIIDSPDGERLVSALTLWILVDPETRKILRPSSFPYTLPLEKTLVNGAVGDVRLPKLLEAGERYNTNIEIRYSHLDTNRHVNNSIYADFVCDALPYEEMTERGIDTLIISFQNEARHGDLLELSTSRLTGREYFISGRHKGNSCFEALTILG